MSRCEKTRSIKQPGKKTSPAGNFVIFCSDCGGVLDETFLFSQGVKRDIADLPQSSGLLVVTSWGQVYFSPGSLGTMQLTGVFLGRSVMVNESGFLQEVVGDKGLVA